MSKSYDPNRIGDMDILQMEYLSLMALEEMEKEEKSNPFIVEEDDENDSWWLDY